MMFGPFLPFIEIIEINNWYPNIEVRLLAFAIKNFLKNTRQHIKESYSLFFKTTPKIV